MVDLETLRLIRDLSHACSDDTPGAIEARADAHDYLRAHCPCPAEDRVDRSHYNRTYPFYCGICGEARPAPVGRRPTMVRPKL